MTFDSLVFFIFLGIVFSVYWILKGKTLWQNVLLLASSYVFYGWWDWRFLGLILFTTMSSYCCALVISECMQKGEKSKASWMNATNIIVNLGILALFKYYNFFTDSISEVLTGLGIGVSWPVLHLVLPVGISFYTFQSLSYTIDVRRGSLHATRNLLTYATYIAFFPQLVAGPIERASRLLPQFEAQRTFSNEQATLGCRMMLWGFFKKIVIADNCAITVEQIFNGYEQLGTLTLLYGAVLFAFQIYADFSGYSEIAIGTARLFGIQLSSNFDHPYFATSIPDFWRRWHISLTSWFRDYVYIPLGGSRISRCRTFLHTLIVFSLSGLWHGANWTFVVWGFYHGALFFPYNMRWTTNQKEKESGVIRCWFARCLTFLLICIGWVLFRSESLPMAFHYISRMMVTLDFSIPPYSKSILLYVFLMLLAEWKQCSLPRRTWQRWLIYYSLVVLMLWKATQGSQFIYFQF